MAVYRAYQVTIVHPESSENTTSYLLETYDVSGKFTARYCMDLDLLASLLSVRTDNDEIIFPNERKIIPRPPNDVEILKPLSEQDLLALCNKIIAQSRMPRPEVV